MFSNKSSHDVRSLRPLVLGGPLEAARKANVAAAAQGANAIEADVAPVNASLDAAPAAEENPLEAILEPIADEPDLLLETVSLAEPRSNARVTFKADLAPDAFSQNSRKAEKARAAAEAKAARVAAETEKVRLATEAKKARQDQRDAKKRAAADRLAEKKAAKGKPLFAAVPAEAAALIQAEASTARPVKTPL